MMIKWHAVQSYMSCTVCNVEQKLGQALKQASRYYHHVYDVAAHTVDNPIKKTIKYLELNLL